MDRDSDIGGRDLMFGATGIGLCAVIAILFAIFA
jgi:hypothetical protein